MTISMGAQIVQTVWHRHNALPALYISLQKEKKTKAVSVDLVMTYCAKETHHSKIWI